jgi:hypothetical protein
MKRKKNLDYNEIQSLISNLTNLKLHSLLYISNNTFSNNTLSNNRLSNVSLSKNTLSNKTFSNKTFSNNTFSNNTFSKKIQDSDAKIRKKIRAVDADAENKFVKLLRGKSLTFTTLEKFTIEVEENGDKLDAKVKNKSESFDFKEIDVMWIGCGKDYDCYDDMSYYEHLGNSVLFIKGKMCICVSTDIRQFNLQRGEKVLRYVSTIDCENDKDDKLRSSGFIKTNLGYYALSSFNNRNGFLPKQFVSNIDEYRFRLHRWSNNYPYGQVKKISIEILSRETGDLKKDVCHTKKDNPNLKKWFS